MRKALFASLAVLTIAGCDQSGDQSSPKYERTRRFITGEDGITRVDATLNTEAGTFVAHASYKVKTMVGLGAQKVDFGECGRVIFTISDSSSDIRNGLNKEQGFTSKCPIKKLGS